METPAYYGAAVFQKRQPRLVRNAAVWVTFATVTVATVVVAYPALFSYFATYDDEGYLLVSLKGFQAGGHLYDRVYSQYGPFFFEAIGKAYSLLGLSVSHDTGRFTTLAMWVATSLLAGYATFRLTRRISLGVGTQLVTFSLLSTLRNEPMHPGGLLCLLLISLVAVVGIILLRYPRVAMSLIGALTGALLLVKINVGAFVFVALVFAIVMDSVEFSTVRLLKIGSQVALILLPVVIMAGKLHEDWVQRFAMLVAISALAVVVATIPSRNRARSQISWRSFAWVLAGMAVVVTTTAGLILVDGTSLTALLEGVVTKPLGQGRAFSVPLSLPSSVLPFALLMVLCATPPLRSLLLTRTGRPSVLSAAIRIAAGATIGFAVLGHAGSLLGFSLPLAWVAGVAPRGVELEPSDHPFVRVLLPPLAVLQALHSFPVAGSQVAWSAMLMVPVAAICVSDGIRILHAHFAALDIASRPRSSLIRLATGVAAAAVIVVLANVTVLRPYQSATKARASLESLGLPGATRIKLSAQERVTHHWVVSHLHQHCSTFVSLPGMNSYYFFARDEPPTSLNATSWMFLFDASMQQRVVRRLEHIRRLCVLRNDILLAVWTQGRTAPALPLFNYVTQNFVTIEQENGYQIMVRKGVGA